DSEDEAAENDALIKRDKMLQKIMFVDPFATEIHIHALQALRASGSKQSLDMKNKEIAGDLAGSLLDNLWILYANSGICVEVNSSSLSILRELARNLETMEKSSKIDISIEEMNIAIQELKDYLKFPLGLVLTLASSETKSTKIDKLEPFVTTNNTVPLVGVIPLITFASLLIEISACIEVIVDVVQEPANKADFKIAPDDKPKQNKHRDKNISKQFKDGKTMKTLERV
ncbi:hypothetical protein ACH5RR_041797, partial [Cinchona calisaya]